MTELFSDDTFWTKTFTNSEDWLDTTQFQGAAVITFPEPDEGRVTFKWEPMPHQVPPDWLWDLWLLFGGRGIGKTDGGAMWFNDHMTGPPCDPRLPGGHKAAIIAPTLGDAYGSCVIGPSGLKVHNPAVVDVTRKGGTYVIWPNGATAKLFGAYGPQDVERLRAGGGNCAYWCEEFAAWPYMRKVWDQLQFGLRLGEHPRGIATTTPRNRKLLRELLADPTTAVTSARTEDNPYLPEATRSKLYKKFKGTRQGKQELDGLVLEDVPGAVATVDQLASGRRDPAQVPKLTKRIVVLDPAQTNTDTSDATGIAVGGIKGTDVYQLADASMKGDISEWVDEAIKQAVFWECAEIWYESTGGSNTYRDVINAGITRYNENLRKEWELTHEDVPESQRPTCPRIMLPVKPVPALLSKRDRAVALEMAIQQERFHLVGDFEQLEEQLTTWVPGDTEDEDDDDTSTGPRSKKMDSPNNMDAAVHMYRILMGLSHGPGKSYGQAVRQARLPT